MKTPRPCRGWLAQSSRDERYRTRSATSAIPQTVRDFVAAVSDAGDAAPVAGAHSRPTSARSGRVCGKWLEGPAPARALLRSRSADDWRRCDALPAPPRIEEAKAALSANITDFSDRARASWRLPGTTTLIGWRSIRLRTSAMRVLMAAADSSGRADRTRRGQQRIPAP